MRKKNLRSLPKEVIIKFIMPMQKKKPVILPAAIFSDFEKLFKFRKYQLIQLSISKRDSRICNKGCPNAINIIECP